MSSLNALIREVVAENPTAHAHKLAKLVAERTDPADLHDFYALALEPLVADKLRASRNAIMNSKQGRSPKVEQRRTWWAQMLRERVHVGESKWLTIAECGVAELDFCISERNDQIAALHGQIEKYRKIRDAVVAHGVETVAHLPEGSVEL